jgi:hypothetical protein
MSKKIEERTRKRQERETINNRLARAILEFILFNGV